MPNFNLPRNPHEGKLLTDEQLARMEQAANQTAADLLRQLEAARERERQAAEARRATASGVWPGDEFLLEKIGANGLPDPAATRRVALVRWETWGAPIVRYLKANGDIGLKDYTLSSTVKFRLINTPAAAPAPSTNG